MSDSFNAGRGLKSTFTGKAARNDITGALIKTGPVTDAYRNSPFWCSHEMDAATNECRLCGVSQEDLTNV